MTGVEYRLGHTDHLVVEDFLSQRPTGVAGIVIDEKNLETQQDAIDAAHTLGVDVHVEPLTDRLVAEGFSTRGLDYGFEQIDPLTDLSDVDDQDRLVEAVIAPQLDVASAITPPHFFVETDEVLDLNLSLLRRATQQVDGVPLRPILAAQRTFLDQPGLPELIARRYRREGAEVIDLRISPLGGEREGAIKLRSVLNILQGFKEGGIDVVMGSQGTIGETALAMGLSSGFSVGIGYREKYNHKEAIRRQAKPSSSGGGPRGPIAGIYLPDPAITVPRHTGKKLYKNREIRTRLMCRIGSCREHIDGPVRDPRGHYLHARAAEVAEILDRPPQWRPMLQRDRLARAVDVRDIVNKYLPPKTSKLKTRTLRTLIAELDDRMEAVA